MSAEFVRRDYSLVGRDSAAAEASGLASASWYRSAVSRADLKALMQRRDGPAIRDTLIWFAALGLSGAAGYWAWETWWAVPAFAVYGVLYGSASDSRWHECGHGTAFRTRWMNDAVYQIACFMILREPTIWRWSHTRHHTDTSVVGRDPELAVPRPPDVLGILLNLLALKSSAIALKKLALHAAGRLTGEEATYVPKTERGKVTWIARLYLAIFAAVAAWCVAVGSVLPAMFIGLPTLYGGWLMLVFGLTQHAGLDEDVLDHRLNSRTVYMNPLLRFLYWNMNYHVEHHMFPTVPYHALPRLHAAVKTDCPTPYSGLVETYREIIPAIARQVREPTWFVKRQLPRAPGGATLSRSRRSRMSYALRGGAVEKDQLPMSMSWIEACGVDDILKEDVMRLDHGARTFAVYRSPDDRYYATDGLCTHAQVHLSEGFVMDAIIECPMHNGRFDYRTGAAQGGPVCVDLKTYPVKVEDGKVYVSID